MSNSLTVKRALLQEEVEVEDFLTGEMRTEIRESRVMIARNIKTRIKKIEFK